MSELINAILVFVFCVLIHTLLHRMLLFYKHRSFSLMMIYIFGLALHIALLINGVRFFNISFGEPLQATSLLLYILLSVLMGVLYLPSVVKGSQTPADIILKSLKEKSKTKKELLKLFSYELLVERRIEDLKMGRLVIEEAGILKLTTRGKIAGFFIHLAEVLLGIPIGG